MLKMMQNRSNKLNINMPTKTIVYDASNNVSPDIKRLLKEDESVIIIPSKFEEVGQ